MSILGGERRRGEKIWMGAGGERRELHFRPSGMGGGTRDGGGRACESKSETNQHTA